MKKIFLGIGILALALVIVTSLLITAPKDEIVIGVLVPLTGPSASVGERVRAGIEVGIEELKTSGAYDFKIVFEDDKGLAQSSVSAAQKLIATDDVHIIIGTVKSDGLLAVAPVAEAGKVVLLSPTAGAESITNAGDFVFRLIETPSVHGQAAAAYIGADKRIALFTAKAANAQSYSKHFKSNFESLGGTITSEVEYNPEDTDFRTDVAKASNADAMYLAVATAKDAGLLTRQIRESGFTGIVMASVAADAREFFDAAGEYAEGTVITASFFDSTTPEGAAFNARYTARTGRDGDGFAANGYDAVMLIAAALKHCGSDKDTTCIRDFLYSTQEYAGAGGVLSFDRNGDVTKPVSIKIARGGAFVLAK